MMIPLALGMLLLVAASIVALSAHKAPGGGGGARRPVDRGTQAWANEIRRRLPAAFDAQQIAKAGPERKGTRPRPAIIGAGQPANGGWQWRLNLPGNSQADDWDPNRIAAALNSGDRIAAVSEIHHAGEGWATLTIWRADPLSNGQRIPWQPGTMPSCCQPGTVCIGKQRDGSHIHFDLLVDGSGLATLLAGRRGSGKSETARLVIAQCAAWGWAAPIVVDLTRNGVDYHDLEPVLDRPVITDKKTALALIDELHDEAKQRAAWLKSEGRQKMTAFTSDMPLRVVVWEEVQSLNDDAKMKAGFRRWVQEARPLGSVPVLITQYPHTDNIDSTLRAQVANTWCGRVRNHIEAGVVFGPLPEGQGPHFLRLGPGGCYADVDGPDLLQGRTWHMAPGWLAAHVRALAVVHV